MTSEGRVSSDAAVRYSSGRWERRRNGSWVPIASGAVTPPEPLTVDYFAVAYALGRALEYDSPEFWQVVTELDKTLPQFAWANTMTDGPTRESS